MEDMFDNDYPGEDVCPFCGEEIEEIGYNDVAAEDDGAFWVDRHCYECDTTWRDYYNPDDFPDTCPECDSRDIRVDDGEIDLDVGRADGSCDDCGANWMVSYTYWKSRTL